MVVLVPCWRCWKGARQHESPIFTKSVWVLLGFILEAIWVVTGAIVGAQALMNVLDGKRYKTLNKEFVDLVMGKYGKIPGKVLSKLKKRVENFDYDKDNDFISVEEHRINFSKFFKENGLKDISKQDTNLLNFILFPKESKEFYQSKNNLSMNDIIGLQEGFGLYIE